MRYARELSRVFYKLDKPLACQDRLNAIHSLLPPSHYAGFQDPLNITGLQSDSSTPVTYRDRADIDSTLNRYSSQAWSFNGQKPLSYSDVQYTILEEVNEPDYYAGPLFPSFNTHWHLVLLQILDKVGIDDGPFESTSEALDQLGPSFLCGICSDEGEDDDSMLHRDFVRSLLSQALE